MMQRLVILMFRVYGNYFGRDECSIPYCIHDAQYETSEGNICGFHSYVYLKNDKEDNNA
jgi:hypothetical protein